MMNRFYTLLWLFLFMPLYPTQTDGEIPLVSGWHNLTTYHPTQTDREIPLTIRLRTAEGQPVTNAAIRLERLPEMALLLPMCQTNSQGICLWLVTPGLYQVLFPGHPLDAVSALAVAEGGLNGLGVTVGEIAIQYTFVLTGDGYIYFDTTPDAAAPSPYVPALDVSQGGAGPQIAGFQPSATSTPTGYPVELTPFAPAPHRRLPARLWGYGLGGIIVGIGLARWRRQRARQNKPAPGSQRATTSSQPPAANGQPPAASS